MSIEALIGEKNWEQPGNAKREAQLSKNLVLLTKWNKGLHGYFLILNYS